MKRNIKKLAVLVIILVAFGTEAKAQIAKEITSSGTCVYSGTFKALPMGQERVQMTYESMGVLVGDTSEDLFHNASLRCLGALHAVKGEYNNSGFCVATRPDGDQIFWTYKSTGKLGGGARGCHDHRRWYWEIDWHTGHLRVYGILYATCCRRNVPGLQ